MITDGLDDLARAPGDGRTGSGGSRISDPSRMSGRGRVSGGCRRFDQGCDEMYPPPMMTVLVTDLMPVCLMLPVDASWNTVLPFDL